MSESKVESNSLFKCDVCLNDYGQSRQQKFLPCLHSFCQSCLTEIQQADGGIKCPICRQLHVDSRDVSSLPSNYFEALKKMRDEHQIQELKLKHHQAQQKERIQKFGETREEMLARLNTEWEDSKEKFKRLRERVEKSKLKFKQ